MAVVLRATDTRTDEVVALKVLHGVRSDAEVVQRFRREFRALSRLLHPNVMRVFEWGTHEDRPWYSMEFIEGVDFGEAAAAWQSLPPTDRYTRVRSAIVQAARALAYAHDRGLVHRDVTPSNLLITADGLVKLVDFGLVSDPGNEVSDGIDFAGTMAFSSPEQIRGGRIDARTDLYGLGSVLYLLLTGRRPFQAHTAKGYMDRHLTEVPKRPRHVEPLVPALLDDVCMRLLEKDPDKRFSSAAHLLHVLGDIAEVELKGWWPPRIVGRVEERARMRRAVEDVVAGRPGSATWITAPAGHGKHRLADFAAQVARRHGLPVARGRCRTHDRPYGGLYGVYEDLEADDPVLHAVFADADETDVPTERYLVDVAFRDLVSEAAPCMVIVEELERGDMATRELTEFLIRNALDLDSQPVVFVVTSEADEGDAPGPWDATPTIAHRHLGPLTPSEVEEVVHTLLPSDAASAALARRLSSETLGSPAFLADMLRGLADTGVLVQDEQDRWRLDLAANDVTLATLPLPDSLSDLLQLRLADLPEQALEVGRTIALAPRSLALDDLLEALTLPEDEVLAAIDTLVDALIVVESGAGDDSRFEVVHEHFRELLAADVDDADRRERHRRLGELLERRHRHAAAPVMEGLAYHFEHAGVPPKAYAYLALAAKKHLQRGLHEAALHFLDRAIAMEPHARPYLLLDDADRRLAEARVLRAGALYHLGDWHEALGDGYAALALARPVGDGALTSAIQAEIGRILWNQADITGASEALEEAIDLARQVSMPALVVQPLYHQGAIEWASGNLDEAHRIWQESLSLAREVGDQRGEGRAFIGLGILAVCRGETRAARNLLEKSAELFAELGVLQQLAIAQTNLVEIYLCTGHIRRALKICDHLMTQAREVMHVHGIALGMVWRSRLLLVLGRPGEARQHAEEALRLGRGLGTVDDQAQALETLIQVLLALGEGSSAEALTRELTEALQAADHEGMSDQARALRARVLICQGQVAEAADILEDVRADPVCPHIAVRRDLDVADAWGRLGRHDLAEAHSLRAHETAKACGYRFYVLLAHQALARYGTDPTTRRKHGRSARSLARSFSAGLDRTDAASFLARGWGEVTEG
jgi:tetratricopeptide (TPR) repeat protein